jgi:hypothetical protein
VARSCERVAGGPRKAAAGPQAGLAPIASPCRFPDSYRRRRAVHSGCWQPINDGPACRKQAGGSTNERFTRLAGRGNAGRGGPTPHRVRIPGGLRSARAARLPNQQGDGRASMADISEGIGLSASAVTRRPEKLEADRVILGYVALLNLKAVRLRWMPLSRLP